MSSKNFLIKNVTILRSDSANSQNGPLQVSQNHQLAINTATHITIFEPKLPSLNQGITDIQNVRILNPRDVFQIFNILNSEIKQLLPIKNFSNLSFEKLDEPFTFGNIGDPIVIQHQWSPNSVSNRDNYLGTLFNTGELLILQRQTTNVDKYITKFNIFDILIKDFQLPIDNEGNYVVSTFEQFLSLKIKTFAFSEIDSTLWLSFISADGSIFFYTEQDNELILKSKLSTNLDIIKQLWSSWTIKSSTTYESHLAVVNSDNSITYFHLTYDTLAEESIISKSKSISTPTRFRNSYNEWVQYNNDTYLISSFTGYIQITNVNTFKTVIQKLESPATVSGIVTHNSGTTNLNIIVAYESGIFESFQLDQKSLGLSKVNVDKSLTQYVGKSLQTFQLHNAAAEDTGNDETSTSTSTTVKKEDNNTGISNDNFRLYLDPNIEGQFIIYGIKSLGGDTLALLYKVIPKNVLYYQTEAQGDIEVAFIQIDNSQSIPTSLQTIRTPLSYLVELWLNKCSEIPLLIIPKTGIEATSLESKLQAIHTYLSDIEDFKNSNFINFNPDFQLQLNDQNFDTDLLSILNTSYNGSTEIFQLQVLLNFDRIVFDSLATLNEDDDELKQYLQRTVDELSSIEVLLSSHLKRIILNYIGGHSNKSEFSEFDKFLLINYYHQFDNDDHFEKILIDHHIEESTISIKTKFFEESFETSLASIEEETTSKLITSTSDHKWSKCQLTGFPLLQLNNRSDELRQYNYIINDDFTEKDQIVNDLLNSIQYCYITGNRTFKLR
ncbi:uncharacterized protein RJT21DRAFT_110986 [Scheffersomyces amazonensis]|uniref:uncharacterized protein n=1 Tax=Scheffersomyces amazonensis TaxID=1078765 RepID=UPI00315DEFA1